MTKHKLFLVVIALLISTFAHAQFMYDNKTSSWLFSESTQNKQLGWHVLNRDSVVGPYGISDYINSSTIINGKKKSEWVELWVLKCHRKGIKQCYIWSNDKSVTVDLDKYQRRQKSDSTRFDRCKSELEPYNDALSYDEFNRRIKTVYRYCHDNPVKKMDAEIYMGWPNTWKTIIRYSDCISLHCYIAASKMTSPDYQYGYTKGRLENIANDMDAVYPNDPNKKENIDVLHSNESDFAGAYFATNSYDDGFRVYKKGFDSKASSKVKRRVNLRNRADFVSGNDKRLRPPSIMKMEIPGDEIRVPKLLIAFPNGNVVVVDQKPIVEGE